MTNQNHTPDLDYYVAARFDADVKPHNLDTTHPHPIVVRRYTHKDAAEAFAAQCTEDGAVSVTIAGGPLAARNSQ